VIGIHPVSSPSILQLSRRPPTLQRSYSVFPDGLPGVGLLLLRAAAGTALICYGCIGLLDRQTSTPLSESMAMLSLAIGLLFFLGYLTPLVAVFAVLTSSASKLAWVPPGDLSTGGIRVGLGFVVIISLALVCLGTSPTACCNSKRYWATLARASLNPTTVSWYVVPEWHGKLS
jgi:hypothetical protein